MDTVVDSQLVARTVYQLVFKASAPDVIQEDGSTTLTKVSTVWRGMEGEGEEGEEGGRVTIRADNLSVKSI